MKWIQKMLFIEIFDSSEWTRREQKLSACRFIFQNSSCCYCTLLSQKNERTECWSEKNKSKNRVAVHYLQFQLDSPTSSSKWFSVFAPSSFAIYKLWFVCITVLLVLLTKSRRVAASGLSLLFIKSLLLWLVIRRLLHAVSLQWWSSMLDPSIEAQPLFNISLLFSETSGLGDSFWPLSLWTWSLIYPLNKKRNLYFR